MHPVIGLGVAVLYFAIGTFIASLVADNRDDFSTWMALFWPVPVILAIGFIVIIAIPEKLAFALKKRMKKGRHE